MHDRVPGLTRTEGKRIIKAIAGLTMVAVRRGARPDLLAA
jgi:hypothetical protein